MKKYLKLEFVLVIFTRGKYNYNLFQQFAQATRAMHWMGDVLLCGTTAQM